MRAHALRDAPWETQLTGRLPPTFARWRICSQLADGFRISAYRRAAKTVESLNRPIRKIAETHGLTGLFKICGYQPGHWPGNHGDAPHRALERLKGSLEPGQLFQTLSRIGPELAARLHRELHVDTLEALELTAQDGRLAEVRGIGERRAAAIRAELSERLGHRRMKALAASHAPPVALLLDVDHEYKKKGNDAHERATSNHRPRLDASQQ